MKTALDLSFRTGTTHDLRSLAERHYLGNDPFPPERVIVAVESGVDVGVLAVSRPTLNGQWRRKLPGFADRANHVSWINDNVRTISRVIVAIDYRGLGVATALVRQYLLNPLTPITEAIAAMGHVSPFFERAGMTLLGEVRAARDDRLRSALTSLGVTPFTLLRLAAIPGLLARSRDVHGALLRWANDSRATRALRSTPDDSLPAIASLAARRLVCPPRVYAHTTASTLALAA